MHVSPCATYPKLRLATNATHSIVLVRDRPYGCDTRASIVDRVALRSCSFVFAFPAVCLYLLPLLLWRLLLPQLPTQLAGLSSLVLEAAAWVYKLNWDLPFTGTIAVWKS